MTPRGPFDERTVNGRRAARGPRASIEGFIPAETERSPKPG